MRTWDKFVDWAVAQATGVGGRRALRRRWVSLRSLAKAVASELQPGEIESLLGKPLEALDPEVNDLKALIAYAAGKGITPATALQSALRDDARADPLHFLAQHSGKTFGEKFAPLIAEFWLASEGDVWTKQTTKSLYDVDWKPTERRGKSIRIELKASSEHPGYLFQQIRHPKLSGGTEPDYDLLLCMGVSAGALEWWAIPAVDLDELAETGGIAPDKVVITLHHGKRQPIWNESNGYKHEGWFRTDARIRDLLEPYAVARSEELREKILSRF